jgi:hypothetical protein
VRRIERVGNLHRDLERLVDRDRSPLDPLFELLALDQLEDQEGLAVGFLEAVDGGDVRVTAGSTLIATSRPSFVSVAR